MATTQSSDHPFLESQLSSALNFSEILISPNEGDHCYLSANEDLPGFGKFEEEVYIFNINTGRKPKTANELKQSPRVIRKWFIENIVACGGHNDFVHHLQSLFLYSIYTDWRLNIGYIISIICLPPTVSSPVIPLLMRNRCRSLTGCC